MEYIYKRICAISVICATLLAVSCSESKSEFLYTLQLSATSVGFDADGGSRKILVAPHPENEAWYVDDSSTEGWVECSVDSNVIELLAEPNTVATSRHTTLCLLSEKSLFDPITITISQEAGSSNTLKVSADQSYSFDSSASSYTFGVEANCEWQISSDAEWVTTLSEPEAKRATISVEANDGNKLRTAAVTIKAGLESYTINIEQDTHANNPYYRLIGSWEISASKWFYSPNGSLNSLDYDPNPSDYYLIFDMEQGEYGKTLIMRNFLYPGTMLEVRYDSETGGIVIPFGWSVLSYDVFLYITLVSSKQFAYAALEVEALPESSTSKLTLKLPTVDGYNYVGFGLWTYNDNGSKVALGSSYRPTMFPMGDVVFEKK